MRGICMMKKKIYKKYRTPKKILNGWSIIDAKVQEIYNSKILNKW